MIIHQGFQKVAVPQFGGKVRTSRSLLLLKVHENLAMKEKSEKSDDLTVSSDSSRSRTQTSCIPGPILLRRGTQFQAWHSSTCGQLTLRNLLKASQSRILRNLLALMPMSLHPWYHTERTQWPGESVRFSPSETKDRVGRDWMSPVEEFLVEPGKQGQTFTSWLRVSKISSWVKGSRGDDWTSEKICILDPDKPWWLLIQVPSFRKH